MVNTKPTHTLRKEKDAPSEEEWLFHVVVLLSLTRFLIYFPLDLIFFSIFVICIDMHN